MAGCKSVSIWNLRFEKRIKSAKTLLKADMSFKWNEHQMNHKIWQWRRMKVVGSNGLMVYALEIFWTEINYYLAKYDCDKTRKNMTTKTNKEEPLVTSHFNESTVCKDH